MSPIRLTQTLSVALCFATLGNATFAGAAELRAPGDISPIVPLTDPAYTDNELLANNGIIGFADTYFTTSSRHALTRHMIAKCIVLQFPMLIQKHPASNSSPKDQQWWQTIRREIAFKLCTHPEAAAALARLIDEFSPEIRQLGAHPEDAKNALVEIPKSVSFPDVPVDHWAARGVRELKDMGIVAGYPGGGFLRKSPS